MYVLTTTQKAYLDNVVNQYEFLRGHFVSER